MSRFAGIISEKGFTDNRIFIENFHNSDFFYKGDFCQIIAESDSDNLFWRSDTETGTGWVIAGTGLQNSPHHSRIMDKNDWEEIFSSQNPGSVLKDINGHFAAISWNNHSLELYTDTTGLRDLYVHEAKDFIYFSTDPLLLARHSECNPDFEEFGSRWLLFNQISHNSIFRGLKRIVAGSSVKITINGGLRITYQSSPKINLTGNEVLSVSEFSRKLKSFINIIPPPDKTLSLSLSGGMDSRVLLSLLTRHYTGKFDAHTFGDPSHPDGIIASDIAKHFSIEHHQFNAGIPDTENCIKGIRDYSASTLVNNAASAFLQLQNYSLLDGIRSVIIDGGFGEIWRREFFYRLYLQGKAALLKGDINGIIPHLRLDRADIFSDDVNELMLKGIKTQLEEILDILPAPDEQNIPDWLDLFAIRTRLPNYYSHEQTRLDNHLTAIMPFIQPDLLNNLPGVPIEKRKNGKLFREIIKTNQPALTKFNLAKGDGQYPFYFSTLMSRIVSKLRSKTGFKYKHVNKTSIMLNSLEAFIRDTISSESFRSAPFYDHSKITHLVDSYYKGGTGREYELDWFLSFEIFRQEIQRKA